MFNFSIPAALKAYIDHIVRVGVTVSPTNVGLLKGKSADIILVSGGDFSPGSPVAPSPASRARRPSNG
jgi:FMN-dependent NADH-azoreductase